MSLFADNSLGVDAQLVLSTETLDALGAEAGRTADWCVLTNDGGEDEWMEVPVGDLTRTFGYVLVYFQNGRVTLCEAE